MLTRLTRRVNKIFSILLDKLEFQNLRTRHANQALFAHAFLESFHLRFPSSFNCVLWLHSNVFILMLKIRVFQMTFHAFIYCVLGVFSHSSVFCLFENIIRLVQFKMREIIFIHLFHSIFNLICRSHLSAKSSAMMTQ